MMCYLPDYALVTIHLSSITSIDSNKLKLRFAFHAALMHKISIIDSVVTPSDINCLGITNSLQSGFQLDLGISWSTQGRPWSTLTPNQIRSSQLTHKYTQIGGQDRYLQIGGQGRGPRGRARTRTGSQAKGREPGNPKILLNPICSCDAEVGTTAHYLLHCPNYLHERETLLDDIKSVLLNIMEKTETFIHSFLLFGEASLDDSSSTIILHATINYITSTKRFDDS